MKKYLIFVVLWASCAASFAQSATQRSNYRSSYITTEQDLITRGIRVGMGFGPSLKLANEGNGFETSSGSLFGLELAWVSIPKAWSHGTDWFSNIGYMIRIESYGSEMSESPGFADKGFSIGAFSGAVTYSYNSELYFFTGLNIPMLSFDNQVRNSFVELEFDGNMGLLFGVGYEIFEDVTVDFTTGEQSYDFNIKSTMNPDLKINLGSLEHTFSRLAVNYTF